jgi:plastocyanin
VSVPDATAHEQETHVMPRLRHIALIGVTAAALAACGSSGGNGSPSGSSGSGGGGTASACQPTNQSGGTAVTIANFAYSPATVQAKVGQPITWTNNDTASHGAILDDDAACTTGSFGQGGSGSLVFSAAGTYTYHCPVHGSSMKGTITVTQ